jgi:hypothetical protein
MSPEPPSAPMPAPATLPLRIAAVVEAAERPALVAAAEQLGACLAAVTGRLWPIRLGFHDSLAAVDAKGGAPLIITSLLSEVQTAEPWPAIEARWRAALATRGETTASFFLCTVFRHVSGGPHPPALERIRRLNLLAAELSHDTGINVIDIDRTFAHLGARALQTDYRLGGAIAEEVAGYVIVGTLLTAGLDDLIPPEIQEAARQRQGPVHEIDTLITRRLRRREALKADGRA